MVTPDPGSSPALRSLEGVRCCHQAVGRFKMHYLEAGQGDVVVMVHGNPSWCYTYRYLIDRLKRRYRVVVPDHLGCGYSDRPTADEYGFRMADRIEDLENFLEGLGLTRNLTLILHDWGGPIGLGYAVRHPERVARLVLLNTAAFQLPGGTSLPGVLSFLRSSPLAPILVQGFGAFSRLAVRRGVRSPLSSEVRRGYLEPYDSWHHRLAIMKFIRDIPLRPTDPSWAAMEQVSEGLEKLRDKPCLICWGEKDPVFVNSFVDEWRRRLPGAEIHTLPQAGHYVLEDAPEPIADLVLGFLHRRSLY